MFKRSGFSERNKNLRAIQAMAFLSKGDFPMKLLVISPHADDAAFSLAGTLKVLVSTGCSVRIVNCFTLSRYAPFAALSSRISVVTRRRQEEELFLHDLGGDCRSDDLGLVDAPQRTGSGIRSILARKNFPDSETVRLLVDALNEDEPASETAILAPLAIGRHSDHYIARQAALAKYKKYPLAFYEDLPYATAAHHQTLAAVEETSSQFEETLEPLLVHWPGDLQWKRQCCSHYKSQISEAGIHKIVDYMKRNSGERLWCSSLFLEAWRWRSTNCLSAMHQEPYFM